MIKHSRCKICNSPYRSRYEQMYLDGASWDEIKSFMESVGDSFARSSFYNHMSKHFKPFIEENSHLQLAVRRKIKRTLSVLEELESNLKICRNLVEMLIRKEYLEDKDVQNVKSLLSEIRETLKFVWQIRESLESFSEFSLTEDEIIYKVVEALEEAALPSEYVTKIETALRRKFASEEI